MNRRANAPDDATVTLPRWLIVMIFGTVVSALGGFLKIESHLATIDTRLALIEYRIGLANPSVLRDWGLQGASPLPAEKTQPHVP